MWLVLDTGTVRNVIEGDERQIDLPALAAPADVRVSIAGPAFAELVNQLVGGQLSFEAWGENVGRFENILDDEWPFFPSGRQLAAFSGSLRNGSNLDEEQRLVQEFWCLLRTARNTNDLESNGSEVELEGRVVPVRVDRSQLRQTVTNQRADWIDYVQSFASELDQTASRADVLAAILRRHGSEPSDAADHRERLMPVFEMIATLVHSSLRSRGGYNPETDRRQGDTFDINLLYVLSHAETVVVTTDGPFVRRLDQTGVAQSDRVLDIEQCNEHLRNGTLTSIIPE